MLPVSVCFFSLGDAVAPSNALETYLAPKWDPEAFKAALDRFAGVWADRDDIDEIYQGMREAGRRRMKRLYPDFGSEADDADDRR